MKNKGTFKQVKVSFEKFHWFQIFYAFSQKHMQKQRKGKKSERRDEPERVFQEVVLDPWADTKGSTEWKRRR